jgi:ABC-type antimicrobial peptide transport system permease subunit
LGDESDAGRQRVGAVRTKGHPASVAGAAQAAVQQLDRDLTITDVQTMPAVLADSLWRPRFRGVLIAVFAGIAVILAAGIYAVFFYLVSRRTQEMGIRVALGAARRQIIGFVLFSVLRVTGIGIAAGIGGSLLLGRVLTSQFNAARPNDAAVIAGVAAVLLAVAVLASLPPAIRATAIDPLRALRQE